MAITASVQLGEGGYKYIPQALKQGMNMKVIKKKMP